MISRLVLVLACLLSYVAPSELFNNLDEKEISFIAYRLQDEKEQRLLLKNDVDVMMLKLGRIERNMEEIKHCKPQQIACPNDWKRHENSCYYFGQESLSWLNASIRCNQKGGHLADIGSATENEYLLAEAKLSGGCHWLDGTDIFSEGEWIWVTKMQMIFGFTSWSVGQPDNANSNEHCLEINFGSDRRWNDRPCSYKEKYICEIEI